MSVSCFCAFHCSYFGSVRYYAHRYCCPNVCTQTTIVARPVFCFARGQTSIPTIPIWICPHIHPSPHVISILISDSQKPFLYEKSDFHCHDISAVNNPHYHSNKVTQFSRYYHILNSHFLYPLLRENWLLQYYLRLNPHYCVALF